MMGGGAGSTITMGGVSRKVGKQHEIMNKYTIKKNSAGGKKMQKIKIQIGNTGRAYGHAVNTRDE